MRPDTDKTYNYIVMDPTGNITALVESSAEVSRQSFIAETIMQKHPEVEQVGFVTFDGGRPKLRMAGGEFCGNASMCAAALYDYRQQSGPLQKLMLEVSGTSAPVEVELMREDAAVWSAGIKMPQALKIKETKAAFAETSAVLPLVRMQGISHYIIEEDSPFYLLEEKKEQGEAAVRQWCEELKADGLGLLFVRGQAPEICMTPLVYIPNSGTVFWEHSCGSGSAALGIYLAERTKTDVSLLIRQPGGSIRVESAYQGDSRMFGTVKLLGEYSLQQYC